MPGSVLARPLELPSGAVLPNRIVKAAMSEHLADPVTGDVTADLIALYRRWARGGAGTLVTGHLMVDRAQVEHPANVVVDARSDVPELTAWAESVHDHGAVLLGQLNHPGRQAPRLYSRHPVGPSAVPGLEPTWMYARPRALTGDEIDGLIGRFADAAALLEGAGFDGVEVHAAHGYLIGQFLSPLTNRRTDTWGGDLEGRARFLMAVVTAIRARVGRRFVVAVKINATDFRPGGFDSDDSAAVVGQLSDVGVDLVEITGGTYEHITGLAPGSDGRAAASPDAYFVGFAPGLRKVTDLPLVLTGGLRTRSVMERLISDGTVDAVGLARPLVARPELPAGLLSGRTEHVDLQPPHTPGPPGVAGALQLLWYIAQLRRLAHGREIDTDYPLWRVEAELVIDPVSVALRRAVHALAG